MAAIHCESFAATHIGLVRQSNEDAYLCRDDAGLWAVADGLGGHASGDLASQTVARWLESVGGADVGLLLEAALGALHEANRELNGLGTWPRAGSVPGTTVALLLILGDEGAVAWAGDSRVYRLRDGELQQLTHDHSHVQELLEEGLIEPEETDFHPMAHAITRAVGIEPTLEVDTRRLEVRPGDRYLLCTDGLSRVLSADEIRAELSSRSLQESIDSMLRATLDRGAPDNVTLVAVGCR